MSWKQRRLLLLSLAHLGLAAIGSASLNLSSLPLIGRMLHHYSAYSGASSQFGFFAPNVGGDLRAIFDLTGPGDRRGSALLKGSSHEADLRIGNVVGILWDKVSEASVRRSMVASWTAKILTANSDATQAVAKIESYDLPTMENYRNGQKPSWRSFYTAKFVLGARR